MGTATVAGRRKGPPASRAPLPPLPPVAVPHMLATQREAQRGGARDLSGRAIPIALALALARAVAGSPGVSAGAAVLPRRCGGVPAGRRAAGRQRDGVGWVVRVAVRQPPPCLPLSPLPSTQLMGKSDRVR